MKKIVFAALVLLVAATAQAQFMGQLTDARVLKDAQSLLGGYVGIYNDNAVSAFGQYRYGMTDVIDGGFKMGFLDPGKGSNTGITVAGDLRYQVLFQKLKDPVDLSLGGGLEFFFGSHLTILSFLANGVISHRFESQTGKGVTPYGRLQARIQRNSPDFGSTNTDGEVGVSLGGEFEVAPAISVASELQLDSEVDFGLLFGVNYRF